MIMKTCSKCVESKPLNQYSVMTGKQVGKLRASCKSCDAAVAKARRQNHPDKARAANRKWYLNHREKKLAAALPELGQLQEMLPKTGR